MTIRKPSSFAEDEKVRGIEIITPRDSKKGTSVKLSPTEFGTAVSFPLDHLTIFDKELTKNYEFVTVEPSYFKDFVRVRIVMDFDIGCGKPCQALVGTYTLREGEKLYPNELKQFGIEPVEIRATTNKITPYIDKNVQIINRTQAIKVIKVKEVSMGNQEKGYSILVKNISDKDIAVIYFSYGEYETGNGSADKDAENPLIRAGTLFYHCPEHHSLNFRRGAYLSKEIGVSCVIFTDGSIDGNSKIGTGSLELLNCSRVKKILAPKILSLVEKTLATADEELPSAVEKLQQQIRILFPNSLNSEVVEQKLKTEYPDLISSLKKAYPDLTEEELRQLTWAVVSGWTALMPLNDLFFDMKTHKERLEGKWGDDKPKISLEQYLRAKLTDIKELYERAINSKW